MPAMDDDVPNQPRSEVRKQVRFPDYECHQMNDTLNQSGSTEPGKVVLETDQNNKTKSNRKVEPDSPFSWSIVIKEDMLKTQNAS